MAVLLQLMLKIDRGPGRRRSWHACAARVIAGWAGGPVFLLCLFLTASIDEKIPLLELAGEDRNQGAPHVFLRVGVRVMPKGLKRYYGRSDLHFLTFSCYRRLPLLNTMRARNLFVHALGKIRERYHFLLVGYVVMPDHVHLLISEPKKVTPSKVLQILKQRVPQIHPERKRRVSRALRAKRRRGSKAQLRLIFPAPEPELRRFWQRRFYDFDVWSIRKKKQKLDYMHANPGQRKLVKHPRDWPWSSWSFYEGGDAGLVKIDPVA